MKMSSLVKGQILTAIKNPSNTVIRVDDASKFGDDSFDTDLKYRMSVLSPDGRVLLELFFDTNNVLLFDKMGESFLKINGEKIAIEIEDFKELAAKLEEIWEQKGEKRAIMKTLGERGK